MKKRIKLTALLVAIASVSPSFAEFSVLIPLELTNGGSLPTGSIVIGSGSGSESNDNQSGNCQYNGETGYMVTYFKQPMGALKAGDKGYVYQGRIIGFYSPSNGHSGPPSGVTEGALKESNPQMDNYEICVDDSKIYPTVPMPSGGGYEDDEEEPPYNPPEQEDQSGPDWTPECIFNINSDYSAYDTVNGKYVMQSSTFGISVISNTWYHVPSDYDPDREGSYVYLHNANRIPSVSGPNPNYEYTEICRVRKILL
jgi:hypothetical protein